MKGRQRVVSSKFTWLQFSQPIREREEHYAPMRLLGPNIGFHFDDMTAITYGVPYAAILGYGTYGTQSNFRSLLLQLSKSLTRRELDALKSLCSDVVPRDKLETINHGFELFAALEHLNLLSVRNRDFLASKLIAVDRVDLSNQLLGG